MMCLTLEPSPTDNLTFKPLILARSDALVRLQCPLLRVKRTSSAHALMSAFDPKQTLEEECCSGRNERRELDGGTSRGAISADEIIQFVGRRVKRG